MGGPEGVFICPGVQRVRQQLKGVMDAGVLDNFKEIAGQNVGAALIVRGEVVLTPQAKQPLEVGGPEGVFICPGVQRVRQQLKGLVRQEAAIFADQEHLGGQTVTVMGWAKTIRDMKTFGFIELNDGSCFKNLQVVMDAGVLDNFKEIGWLD